METKSTAITMIMSIATFFSRLTRVDACCPETATAIWLLWRRMAMKIPICFAIDRMTRNTAKTSPSTNPVNLGRIKFFTMAKSSQAVPAVVTVLTASVEKKGIFISFRNILIYHFLFSATIKYLFASFGLCICRLSFLMKTKLLINYIKYYMYVQLVWLKTKMSAQPNILKIFYFQKIVWNYYFSWSWMYGTPLVLRARNGGQSWSGWYWPRTILRRPLETQ